MWNNVQLKTDIQPLYEDRITDAISLLGRDFFTFLDLNLKSFFF